MKVKPKPPAPMTLYGDAPDHWPRVGSQMLSRLPSVSQWVGTSMRALAAVGPPDWVTWKVVVASAGVSF